MRSLAGVLALACALALTPADLRAGEDEFAIAKAISDSAAAWMSFPRTRNAASVLKFYAKDYVAIQDGEWQTLKDVERLLADLQSEIDQGHPVRILSRTRNIRVRVDGPTGWATFEYQAEIALAGQTVLAEEGRCTGIYRKAGQAWLFQHEHCSTAAGKEED